MPKLEKVEAIEAKKPPPLLLEAVVCLGSIGAMEIGEKPYENRNPIEKSEFF